MAGGLIALLLFSSLLLVHFSTRARPMPADRPLDVDEGLPLPEAGQASTVFSLTALFGAYLGLYLFVGLFALVGLAFGSCAALMAIRFWTLRAGGRSFEAFLGRVIGDSQNGRVLAVVLVGIQIVYAVSEMLILRDISRAGLGFRPEHATLLVLCLVTIGYLYVLLGGYAAVFRTDIVQLVLVAALGAWALGQSASIDWHVTYFARDGYWRLPIVPKAIEPWFHFMIAAVMGFGFLVTCPDVWKRVHLVARSGQRRTRFTSLLVAGCAPFLLLLPLAGLTPPIPDGPTDVGTVFAGFLTSQEMLTFAGLGLVASFLSAFNSSVLAAVHVSLISRRQPRRRTERNERPRFHLLMASFLVIVSLIFMGTLQLANPYLLATALLGPFAAVTGVLVGSFGMLRQLREGLVIWLVVLASLAWFFAMLSGDVSLRQATTYELNLVPQAVGLSILTAIATVLGRQRRNRNV